MNIPSIEYILKYKNPVVKKLRAHYPEFYNHVLTLPGDKFTEKLWRYFYGEPQGCKVCGKPTKFNTFETGFRNHCSSKCNKNDPDTNDKAKQTCLERYGTEYTVLAPEIAKKSRQTIYNRFGVYNASQSEIVKKKKEKTLLDHYGVINPQHHPEIRLKTETTMYELYGGFGYGSKDIKEKIIQTSLDKYGDERGFLNIENGYSKISQEYFKTLDQQYPHAVYATKGGEYRVGPYLLDWYDPDSNTCIEFNGDYWHANPKLYDKDWIHPLTHRTAEEIWEHDKKRKEYIESLGICVKVVWESEVKK